MTNKQRILLYILAAAIAIAIIIYYRKNLLPQKLNDMLDQATDDFKNTVFLFISDLEGYEPYAVHESTDRADVFTIGYGSIYNFDENRKVLLGDKITKDKAKEWLLKEAQSDMESVQSYVPVPINDNQLLALSSFAYNVGIPAFKGSTLLEMLNNGDDINSVAAQFDRWIYSDGKVNKGLKNRRAKEKEMFLS